MKKKKLVYLIIITVFTVALGIALGKTYSKYVLTKDFETTFSSQPFYFEVQKVTEELVIRRTMPEEKAKDESVQLDLAVQNFLEENTNQFDTEYEIAIEDGSGFTISNANVVKGTLTGGSQQTQTVNLTLGLADSKPVNTLKITVKSTKPYEKKVELEVKIINEWLIEKIEDLAWLSKRTNEGKTYSGDRVLLMDDLDFQEGADYRDPENATTFGDVNGDGNAETIKTELTTENGFMPIGKGENYFESEFLGQKHTLSNILVNSTAERTDAVGLFGKTKNVTIKDFTINGNITATGLVNAGALIGENIGSSTLENIESDVAVSAPSNVGGIIGASENNTEMVLKNITNNGKVDGYSTTKGGIVGSIANGTVEATNCLNTGNITNGGFFGGIFGSLKDVKEGTFTNIVNSGNLDTTTNKQQVEGSDDLPQTLVGGLIGRDYISNVTINGTSGNSTETFTVNSNGPGSLSVGGIVGWKYDGELIIKNCNNNSNMIFSVPSASTMYAGGIIGYNNGGHTVIEKCNNVAMGDSFTATGSGTFAMGGIVGYASPKSNVPSLIEIDSCHNLSNIKADRQDSTGLSYLGGCLGYITSGDILINKSYNTGNITLDHPQGTTGLSAGGGIIGYNSKSKTTLVMNSYNTGRIGHLGDPDGNSLECYDNFAGIIGAIQSDNSVTILNSYNIGNIEPHRRIAAGIATWSSGSATVNIYNVYNAGDLKGFGRNLSHGILYKHDAGTPNIINAYYKQDQNVVEQNTGTTDMTDTDMKDPSKLLKMLNANATRIMDSELEPLRKQFIEDGVITEDYAFHLSNWKTDSKTGYPTLANE